MAKELGISEQIVANQGEYAPAGSIFSYAFVGRDITGVSLSDQIFNIQQKLIKDIAQKIHALLWDVAQTTFFLTGMMC